MAVPLGVLKKGSITFDPPLPHRKTDAIRAAGFGNLNKLVLRYAALDWLPDPSRQFYALVRSGESARGFLTYWVNMQPVNGQPVLVGHAAGARLVRRHHNPRRSLCEPHDQFGRCGL